jgi:hypothetical protein
MMVSQGPTASEPFRLIQQEGWLVHELVATGLTAVRCAHIDRMGVYYSGFFSLSVGIERLVKLVIILDHMASHHLAPPDRTALRAHGHNLLQLLSSLQSLPSAEKLAPLPALETGTVEHAIICHLDRFGRSSRYHNLDVITTGQPLADPLAEWASILELIVESEERMNRRSHIEAQSKILATHLAPHVRCQGYGLRGERLTLATGIFERRLYEIAAPRAIWRICCLLLPIRHALVTASEEANRVSEGVRPRTATVPYMADFLQYLEYERSAVLRKRRWP